MSLRKRLSALALASSVSALAMGIATNAFAQDEPEEDEIIVTGSRIATDAATSAASPVQVIGAADVQTSGQLDIADLLRESPALQGSLPGSLSTVSAAGTEDSDTGLSLLDLRSLGEVRTLVLQNGRRHVPGTGGQAAVDVNTIPVSLLDRVDVFTGGASSIYGADAVTGVVNFILRDGRDFDGLEFRTQAGISDQGDAEEVFVSVAGGGEYADGRGSAVFSVEYTLNTSITAQDRPDFTGAGAFTIINNSPALASAFGVNPDSTNILIQNQTLPISSQFGNIAINNSAFVAALDAADASPDIPLIPGTTVPGLQVIDGGVLRPFNAGIVGDPFAAVGGDGITQNAPGEIILPEQDRFLVNAAADYEITENIEAFFEGKFAFTDTTDQDGIPFSDDIPIQLDNPFIPAALQTQLDEVALATGEDPFITVSRDILDPDVFPVEQVDRTTFRFVGGLRGEIPGLGFDWEASANYGRTEVTSNSINTRIEDRYFAAIDAVALTDADLANVSVGTLAIRNGESLSIDPSSALAGDIVCRSQLDGTAPGVSPFPQPPTDDDGLGLPLSFAFGDGQCAPINILGNGAISGAGADFAFLTLQDSTVITQLQLLGTLSGDTGEFFELPGGPIGFALGVEYREDTSVFQPDSLRFAPAITAGGVNSGPTFPSPILTDDFPDQINVFEGFVEAKLPVLADLPFAKLLEVSGSARFSDYNTIGRTTAWSVGGRWQPFDWATLRGTYSRAVRAPNIGELFSPISPATIGATADPCDAANIGAGSSFRESNCLQFVAAGFDATQFLSAFVPGTSGGNPNLEEESATTFTFGTVLQPGGFLEGLRVIADFYDIEIEGAIGSLTGAEIAEACVDLPTTDNTFCDNIFRDPTDGFITGFTAGQINLGLLETRGVDWAVQYNFDIADVTGSAGDFGNLNFGANGTRFLQFNEITDPTSDVIIASIEDPLLQEQAQVAQDITNDSLGEIGLPRWIVNFNADWTKGPLTLTWNGRFESSTLIIDNIEAVSVDIEGGAVVVNPTDSFLDFSQQETGSGFVHDFNISYEFSERLSVYGGINNAFDRDPFFGSLIRPVGPRGRFFFLGVQAKL